MEVISIAVLTALVAAIALGRRRPRHDTIHSRRTRKRSFSASRGKPTCPKATAPRPFDPCSAKPHVGHPSVRGPAYVVDGDTLRIKNVQIRLHGVDAPELNHPFGRKAKWALHTLCKDRVVHAELLEKDAFGRTVAFCKLDDGRDLSAEMVKLGLAIDWPRFSGGKYRAMEQPGVRKRLWLADARQRGHMHVWQKFEAEKATQPTRR